MIRVMVEVDQVSATDIRRRVVSVEQVGARTGCHAPVPVYVAGRRIRYIRCGRRLPRDQHCPGCRVHILPSITLAIPSTTSVTSTTSTTATTVSTPAALSVSRTR